MLLFSLNVAVFAVPLKMWLHSIKINTKPLNKLQAFARYPHLNCWVCVKYQTKPKVAHQTMCDQVVPADLRPLSTRPTRSLTYDLHFTRIELSVKSKLCCDFCGLITENVFSKSHFVECVFHLKVSVPSIISLLDYKFSH